MTLRAVLFFPPRACIVYTLLLPCYKKLTCISEPDAGSWVMVLFLEGSGFKVSKPLDQVLNEQVANFGVLYMKLHNFHWFVKGPQFFTLHAKFEELYNEATLHFDAVAERLLTLGGRPVATMKEMLSQSSIQEAAGTENAEAMVGALVNDFNLVIGQLKEGIGAAEQAGDETTGDLLLAIHSSLEKHVWMLKSFLG